MLRLFRHAVRVFVIGTCLIVAAACGEDGGRRPSEPAEVVQRDSAGILIVETPGSLARAPIGWRVGEEPDLQIGSVDGGAAYEFDDLDGRIVGLPDGRIVVLDGGTLELRFFDSEGRFVNSAGGRGNGPGEFQGFPYLFPYPSSDSVLVVDNRLRRLTLFSSDGEGHRVLSRPGEPSSELVMGAGRGVLGSKILRTSAVDLDRHRPEKGRDPSPIGLLLGDLETGDDEIIVRFDVPVYVDPDEPNTTFRRIRVPFHVPPSAVWGSGTFFVVGGHQPEVREFDSDGRLIRIMRVTEAPRPVTRQDLDNVISSQSRLHPEASVRRVYGRMELPEFWPTFQDVHVDPLGWVWVALFRPPYGDVEANRWMIFDPDGVARGTIDLPQQRFLLTDIGPDYVLGLSWDDLRVQYVRRYRLHR